MRHPGVLVDELAHVIRTERGAKQAEAMAIELLDRDGAASLLIGLAAGGCNAVYYHPGTRGIVLVPFDALGVEGLLSRRVRSVGETRNIDSWLATRASTAFAWIHPRFRWLTAD